MESAADLASDERCGRGRRPSPATRERSSAVSRRREPRARVPVAPPRGTGRHPDRSNHCGDRKPPPASPTPEDRIAPAQPDGDALEAAIT